MEKVDISLLVEKEIVIKGDSWETKGTLYKDGDFYEFLTRSNKNCISGFGFDSDNFSQKGETEFHTDDIKFPNHYSKAPNQQNKFLKSVDPGYKERDECLKKVGL